jgi:hypothetical protein
MKAQFEKKWKRPKRMLYVRAAERARASARFSKHLVFRKTVRHLPVALQRIKKDQPKLTPRLSALNEKRISSWA